jgi:hypothetical protein
MPRWPKKRDEGKAEGVISQDGGGVKTESQQATTEVQEGEQKKVKYLPYTGKESLPPFRIIQKGDPARGIHDRFEYGEPRFAVARGERKTLKVIAFFRRPGGVVRKLYAVIKAETKNPKQRELLQKLKAAGIPGAF